VRLQVRSFSIAKSGNQDRENEDAYQYDVERGLLAVADGASDAFESRRWAQTLAEAFIREPPPQDPDLLQQWLAAPIEEWKAGINWADLPWYGAEKARRGAFATLLGLIVEAPAVDPGLPVPAVRWQAMAVGDSCLFQVRGQELLAHLPVERSAEFDTTPALLSTRPEYNRRSLRGLCSVDGECRPGDIFLLATDALSAWLLRQEEQNAPPWRRFAAMGEEELGNLLAELRSGQEIRDDDVTLLQAYIGQDGPNATDGPPPAAGAGTRRGRKRARR